MTRLFRTDGDHHEFFGHALTGAIAFGLTSLRAPGEVVVVAIAWSTFNVLYLSPDCDFAYGRYKSKALHRWRRAGLLWWWHLFNVLPYCKHRQSTHVPVAGAFVLMAWGTLPIVFLLWIVGVPLSVIFGVAIVQQLGHLMLD